LPNIDVAAVSLPTELLGGDFLDTIRLESENESFTLGIFIFDVMGHGTKSMQIKALTKKIFGQFFEHWIDDHSGVDMMKPHLFMTALNKELLNDCQSAGMFITSFYGVIDPKEKVMTYTSAGHDPPILVKSQGEYIHFDVTELIIGADKDVEYHEEKVTIVPGDTLILYSDGITEVCDDRGEMFEREGLVQAVQQAYTTSAKEIVNQIFRSLRSHVQVGSITDDLSIAVFKIVE
ncbi:serine/threonine-protein phosphatase, partial [bacterium]|nr:serine/threonine-protein phosphatase [bacterium]